MLYGKNPYLNQEAHEIYIKNKIAVFYLELYFL